MGDQDEFVEVEEGGGGDKVDFSLMSIVYYLSAVVVCILFCLKVVIASVRSIIS